MGTPEEQARQIIDDCLTKAGWIIQDRADFDRTAAVGVAVREFMMKDGTEADYLLFVNGKAAGVIEAKNRACPSAALKTSQPHTPPLCPIM